MAGRRFAELGPLSLELGEALPSLHIAYQTWGRPRRAEGRITNAVFVLHALTGDSHVAGPAGPDQPTPGWWDRLVGPGRALDTDRFYVVAANVLGGCRGTTGPASVAPDGRAWGSRFPRITIRDQVAAEALLADQLGIDRYAAVIGGSMGGMRALEWLVGHPNRVASALVLAVGARTSADQIGLQSAQLAAIRQDPNWDGGDYHPGPGPLAGMGLARRIAHLSYRSETELEARFGRDAQGDDDPLRDGQYAVQSYLDHHADKLARRFDPGSYVTLTEAMNTHDVGRGRAGVAAALRTVRAPTIVAGIDSDRLYPLRQQAELADGLASVGGLRTIASPHGHDGFLIETDAVGELIGELLALDTQALALSGKPAHTR